MSKWDLRFLKLAEEVASWSKDPSTKVGAVITRPDNTVASLGYNGFPRGCRDAKCDLEDRKKKYARTVHAELNAILNAKEPLTGYTIYVTHPPCCACACAIVQAGIVEVITRHPSKDLLERWGESIDEATEILIEGGAYLGQID